ncbi:MAG: PaRep2b protein [Pyrobaculum sp.]
MVEAGRVVPVAGGAAAPVAVKGMALRLYMRKTLMLVKYSKDQREAEAAAEVLRALGVAAEARRGESGVWRVEASVRMLAAGARELREAVAKAVGDAVEAGLVPEARARRWLEALERGRAPLRGYGPALSNTGALAVRFISTNAANVEREAQRLRDMGLVEGLHFTAKMPEGGKAGRVSILKEGLIYAAWLSVRGKDEQQRRLAAELVEGVLEKAERRGGAVGRKVREVVEGGRAWGSLTLRGFEREVEVGGRRHVVKVLFWDVEVGEALRISITAEVDGVEDSYTVAFRRYRGRIAGYAYARAGAPGGREADAERIAAVVKALTGKEPKVRRKGRGYIYIFFGRAHLDGFAQYAELAEAVGGWLIASWPGGR